MSFPVVNTDPGVTRQVLSHNADLMVVVFRFEKGAEGKLHRYVHVQSTYVESGKFKFTIDHVSHHLARGDSVIIASNLWHGCVCEETGVLIDTFTPRRDDFL